MIYAVKKPVEEYVVNIGGMNFGIYEEHKDEPELLALLLIGTPFGYYYEGNIPDAKRPVTHPQIEDFKASLDHCLGGEPIGALLRKYDPLQFFYYVEKCSPEELSSIPYVRNFYKGKNDWFLLNVAARATVWAMNYRGKMNTVGNVTNVAFGKMKIRPDLMMHHEVMYKEFANEK